VINASAPRDVARARGAAVGSGMGVAVDSCVATGVGAGVGVAMQNQDFAKAKKLIGKIYELKEKKELKKIEHFEAVWNELTPEQQEEAKNIQPERMHRNMMNNKMERQHRNWQDDED
jgi:hypothetical protein